jgi:UPF0271 protein
LSSSYALDAGAFYAGIPFLSSGGKYHTTEAVFNEIKHIKSSHAAIEALIDSGSLQIIDPDQVHIEKVSAVAKKTGDIARLSPADLSIIALAMQLKIALVTDDYAAANVATFLKIPVRSTSTKGIKEIRKWITYCSACSRTFGPDTKECPLCGNRLKRKYKKVA